MDEFKGKAVIVTGAGSGIGRACAEAFAQEGAKVTALDLDAAGLEETVRILREKRLSVASSVADISDEQKIKGIFYSVKQREGSIDALINCAGIISFEKFQDHDLAHWNRIIGVNLTGTYHCCRFAGMIMREQKFGAIVNISAGAAKTGGMNPCPAYIASKGGINSLTFHFAVQLAKDGVRVNCICPGPIDGPMIDRQAELPGAKGNGKESIIASVPLGLGLPSDIAEGALFLASPRRARYITGEILDINGGLIMD